MPGTRKSEAPPCAGLLLRSSMYCARYSTLQLERLKGYNINALSSAAYKTLFFEPAESVAHDFISEGSPVSSLFIMLTFLHAYVLGTQLNWSRECLCQDIQDLVNDSVGWWEIWFSHRLVSCLMTMKK